MSIVVVGCGRSGTNMALEILRGSPELHASKNIEDKKFFHRGIVYPKNYLTKCDTCYFGPSDLVVTMMENADMKLVWTIRDLRDMAMSKLRRGVPTDEGGDCRGHAADATPSGCIADISHMHTLFVLAQKKFAERLMLVKMEDMVCNGTETAQQLAAYAGVRYIDGMERFWERMRNEHKRQRYQTLDWSQIAMWKHWQDCYDGWLQRYDMEFLFRELEPFVRAFGYEL